ncbi:MAG: helix-turn-helix transcriptional regulator [Christensenellaceae bacterium]|nr:helix-turn-helix transcriptional regulator [Christensenellaceae bacterium]
MSLGSLIKKARLAKGYTQEDLQKKSKVGKDIIGAAERGTDMPTDSQIRALAKALDLQAIELLEAKKAKSKNQKSTSKKTSTKKVESKAHL